MKMKSNPVRESVVVYSIVFWLMSFTVSLLASINIIVSTSTVLSLCLYSLIIIVSSMAAGIYYYKATNQALVHPDFVNMYAIISLFTFLYTGVLCLFLLEYSSVGAVIDFLWLVIFFFLSPLPLWTPVVYIFFTTFLVYAGLFVVSFWIRRKEIGLKKCLIALLIVILLAVVGFTVYWFAYYKKYAPAQNPRPKYFLSIKGHVNPSIKKDLSIIWTTTYLTTSDACDKTVDWLEGASVQREKELTYPVEIGADGHYVLKIPLDAFIAGHCGWHIIDAGYRYRYKHSIRKEDEITGLTFQAKGAKQVIAMQQLWECKKKKCHLIKSNYRSRPYSLNSFESHQAEISFQ